jgi:hypothetical protein
MAALCTIVSTRPTLITKADITAIFQRLPASRSPLRRFAALVLVAQTQIKKNPAGIEDFDGPVFAGMARMLYNYLHIWCTRSGLDKKKARLPQLLQMENIHAQLVVEEPEPTEWVLRLCGLAPQPMQMSAPSGFAEGEVIESE